MGRTNFRRRGFDLQRPLSLPALCFVVGIMLGSMFGLALGMVLRRIWS